MKVLCCFGTRPEAIKFAPLIKELKKRPWAELVICSTGQHKEMLEQVLSIFDIVPDLNLQLMTSDQSLSELTSRAIASLDGAIEDIDPDITLVQGDTTTTLCASIVSFYHGIPVGHIEAGLRTDSKYAPFPEEINRRVVSVLADYYFAPTQRAADALAKEGYPRDMVSVVGNTVIDALLYTVAQISDACNMVDLETRSIVGKERIVLITGHRRESFGDGIEHICNAISALAKRYRDVRFVYPVHLNPNVKVPVTRLLSGLGNVVLIEPLSYTSFVWLLNKCYIVITDSGGIQEEAPTLGKPVIVTRDTTERLEAVEAGVAKLVGTNEKSIVNEISCLLDDENHYKSMSRMKNPYGDGRASQRIADILERKAEPNAH